MKPISLKNLLHNISDHQINDDVQITGISLDSREIKPGDVFLACHGNVTDGRKFIASAIANGASAILCEGDDHESSAFLDNIKLPIPFVSIKNLSEKIGEIAARFYGEPSKQLKVYGVTGTNGKTSCSHFIAKCLEMHGESSAIIGTLGNGSCGHLSQPSLTTPNQIALQKSFAEFVANDVKNVAMEVSSHGLEQHRVNGILFGTAVFTNLTRDHLDYHLNMENYGNAKRKLFYHPGLKNAVINMDDEFGRTLIHELKNKIQVYSYSISENHTLDSKNHIQAQNIKLDMKGISATVQTPWGEGILQSSLLGRFNLSNLLAVLTVLGIHKIPLKKALEYISKLHGVAGRMEIFRKDSKPLVVVDYAHTPDALKQLLVSMREYCHGRIWVVFGCGGDRDRGKRPLMAEIAENFADQIVVTDDNPRTENPKEIVADIMKGLHNPEGVVIEHDRYRAIAHAISCAHVDDAVLVAGKGHETYQQIGLEKKPFSDAVTVQMLLNE